jgi:hypothetical protein
MALRASWNVNGWSDTGLAFGIKPRDTASGTPAAINIKFTGLVTALRPSPAG